MDSMFPETSPLSFLGQKGSQDHLSLSAKFRDPALPLSYLVASTVGAAPGWGGGREETGVTITTAPGSKALENLPGDQVGTERPIRSP